MAKKGYTSKTDVENYILQEIDASFDNQLDTWIEGVEKAIDQYTGRNFIADDSETERVYDGDGTHELLVDDCIEVTKVEVGNDSYGGTFTEIPATGAGRYFTDPANHEVRGEPIHKITLSDRMFPAGKQNNQITAKWGYSRVVPSDIKFAATVFVAGILNEHRDGGGEVQREKIGNYDVTYVTDSDGDAFADFKHAMAILDSYKKLNI